MKNKPRGRNGGRKSEYNEPTELLSFRVPVSKSDVVKAFVLKIQEAAKISKSV